MVVAFQVMESVGNRMVFDLRIVAEKSERDGSDE